jgi:pyrimidine-nucleoside phosphorylase
MVPQWIIEKKRNGSVLTEEDIREFIAAYDAGDVPDYQMAALAMAIYFQGMAFEEVTVLTDAMMRSGDILDTSSIPLPTSDKHSTGGIGDKVSLVLAPLAACCGLAVPMISGRGLGITGGTLDKLESIPGYRTDLDTGAFVRVVAECGCSIIGQTTNLAPVDKKLYALRDVTATVPSIPLIAASIMSKKLAESTDALVLDVKWGAGAFMKTLEQARELARTMVEIGHRMGRGMTAVITDMNQPLGRAAGNALEVIECIEALQGRGPEDLMDVTLELAAQMLRLAGKVDAAADAHPMLLLQIASGAAYERFLQMVSLQGGDTAAVEDPSRLPVASLRREFPADRDGVVCAVDAAALGKAVLVLGAGRRRVTDSVDHAVGATGIVKVDERVRAGQPLTVLHANDENRLDEALELLSNAFDVGDGPAAARPLIVETINPQA